MALLKSDSSCKSIALYGSAALSFAGWFVFWISLAVGQNDLSSTFDIYGDAYVYSGYTVDTSKIYSFSWWAFAYQFFLLVIVSFYPCLSKSFNDSLFTILTLYSLYLFSAVLNSYVFFETNYIRGVVAGAFIISIVDFYWIFYFSTIPSSTSALYVFPPKPLAEKAVDVEAVAEPVVPVAAEPVVPVAPVAEA